MKKTWIIAEAGVNHNGSLPLAIRLVDAAAAAGADAVKFQTFTPEALASSKAPKAGYQQETTDAAESQLAMLRRLALSREDFMTLASHCVARGIAFLSTPFDAASIDLLASMGLETFKIPSGEITNLPYLRKIGGLKKDIILSTGMASLDEVGAALRILEQSGTPAERITLLHCTTEYPAPYDEVNLRAMQALRDAFPGIAGVGYSDHTQGIAIPVAAVAMGATVIEKHFTLDATMEGPDHKASLEPGELADMVRSIRQVEAAMGDGVKAPTASEVRNKGVVRKSIVASRDIQAGELLAEDNLTVKRPGTGISPMLWDTVLGIRAPATLAEDDPVPVAWLAGGDAQ